MSRDTGAATVQLKTERDLPHQGVLLVSQLGVVQVLQALGALRIGLWGRERRPALREPAPKPVPSRHTMVSIPRCTLTLDTTAILKVRVIFFSVLGTKQKVCFSHYTTCQNLSKLCRIQTQMSASCCMRASVSLPRRGDLPHTAEPACLSPTLTVHHTQS